MFSLQNLWQSLWFEVVAHAGGQDCQHAAHPTLPVWASVQERSPGKFFFSATVFCRSWISFYVICIGGFIMSLGVSTVPALLTAGGLFWGDTNMAVSREGSKFFPGEGRRATGSSSNNFLNDKYFTNQRDTFKFHKVSRWERQHTLGLYVKSREILWISM